MTTNLRAALRDAAGTLNTLARRSESSDRHPLVDPDEFYHAAKQYRAIADAPPTIAELLAALPEPPNGRGPGAHRVEWEHDDMRIRAMRYGLAGLVVERRLDGEWSRTNLNHADLTQPARLVEVA